MSGFYGIFRYDGAPVDPDWLARMKQAMAYYGPDGSGQLIQGAVGMGHLLLEVNPEDAFEEQPIRCERGLVVSAVRLDNRDELLEAFGIPSAEAPQISDGHLASLAFDRWGEELCTHLQGDWSLAAWDAHRRQLLLARDALGNSMLYYYEGKGFIAFASSLKALLALPGTVKEPDMLRLAEILVSWDPDAELTAYKDFRNLVWAHTMLVTSEGKSRISRYWTPEGREPLILPRDEEYAEAFLEYFTRAVKASLRTNKPVAAQLSGGRDSGSVVALAAPILAGFGRELKAYTSVPFLRPDGANHRRLGNEWELAHATATMAGANVRHFAIDARNYKVLQGIKHILGLHDSPSHGASSHYWCQAIWEASARDGAGVVITGQFGNATVSWSGTASALLALLQGKPGTAMRILMRTEPTPWLTVKRQVLKPLLTPMLRRFQTLKRINSSPWQDYSALNRCVAEELKIDERMRRAGHDPTFLDSPLENSHTRYFQPDVGAGIGVASEIGAAYSLSFQDPTDNLALVEFLLRVPDDQFCRTGRSSLLQQSFRNRLPDAVLVSHRKGLQAADVGHRIVRELPEFRKCLYSLDSSPEAQSILDLPLMNRCLDDLVASVNPNTTARAEMILARGLGVGLFLQQISASPSEVGVVHVNQTQSGK